MGMHKGMCGRQEVNGPASVETLGTYLEKKYPEEMKQKLTFEDWAALCGYAYYYDENKSCFKWGCAWVDEHILRDCWKAGQENV